MTARVPLAVLCRATPPALGRRRPSPPLLAPASRALGEVQRCADPGAEPRADRLGGRGLRRAAGARRAERGSPRCGEGSSHRKEWLRPGRPLRSLQAVSGAICSPAWHPKRLGARVCVCVCVCVCACARARARSPCATFTRAHLSLHGHIFPRGRHCYALNLCASVLLSWPSASCEQSSWHAMCHK